LPSAPTTSAPSTPPTSAAPVAIEAKSATTPPEGAVAIQAFVGLDDIQVGATSRKELESKLGAPVAVRQHGSYSTSLVFASGIEATFCQNDPEKLVHWISFRDPFKGYVASDTPDPIILGTTTVREARKRLGQCDWTTSDGAPTWSCNYYNSDHVRQLSLHVTRDKTVPQFPLDEALHLDRPIVRIEVAIASNCP